MGTDDDPLHGAAVFRRICRRLYRLVWSCGSLGEAFDKVKVVDVQDNWIHVEKKNKVRLINAEYVTSVKILDDA